MRHRSNDQLRHDGKNYRKMIHGQFFKVAKGHGLEEARRRFDLIEMIFSDLQRQGINEWTREALDLANEIRIGGSLVNFEPSYTDEGLKHLGRIVQVGIHQRGTREQLDEVIRQGKNIKIQNEISEFIENFPSLEFTDENPFVGDYLSNLENQIQNILQKIRAVKKTGNDGFILTDGTLHQALDKYEKYREKPFLVDGQLDQTGHYVKVLIRRLRRYTQDFPLSKLSFSKCQEIIDVFRFRVDDLKKETCSKTVQEFVRFLKWLKKTDLYAWKIDNLDELDKSIKDKKEDRIKLETLKIVSFGRDEIHKLITHASNTQLAMLLLALNCGYGAAESGRLRIENISFDQVHPESDKHPELLEFGNQSWIVMLRPKTNVYNAQLLWPETAAAIKALGVNTGEVLVTSTGQPLYRDFSKNSQSSFGNYFNRLVKSTGVSKLSFGKLRKHFATWLRNKGEAELASMAVQHGNPTKDKLLHHYSNLPYKRYFQAQLEYREYLGIEEAIGNRME